MAAAAAAPRVEPASPPPVPRRPGLIRNFSVLTIAEIAVKAATFLSFTWLARTLGPARYGEIEFTMALLAILSVLADGGTNALGARETARGETRLGGRIAATRLALAVLVYAGLELWLRFSGLPGHLRGLVSVWGSSLLVQPFLLQWFFQGMEQMTWFAAISMVRQMVFLSVLVTGVWMNVPVPWLGAADMAGVIAAAIAGVFAARRFRQERIFSGLRVDFSLLRQSAPIGCAELCWTLQWYLATVQLRLIDQPGSRESLGYYGAAHRITMAMHTFVWLYFVNLLPSIARSAVEPPEWLGSLLDRSLRLATSASTLVALICTAIPGELFVFGFGQRFESAGPYLGALVWLVPVSFASGHYRYTLIGRDRPGWLLACSALSAAVAALIARVLTPDWGPSGAIAALIAAGLCDLVFARIAVARLIQPVPLLRTLTAPAAGSLAFGAVYWLLSGWNPWAAATAASATYAVTALLLR